MGRGRKWGEGGKERGRGVSHDPSGRFAVASPVDMLGGHFPFSITIREDSHYS